MEMTILSAMAMEMESTLEEARVYLRKEAKDLCGDPGKAALRPFRDINHTTPIIEADKKYKFRPSKCPKALEPQWREKSREYLSSGRWKMAAGPNPIPLLLIQKPQKGPGEPIRLRAVFDKREQNANTKQMASPLPDQSEVPRLCSIRRMG